MVRFHVSPLKMIVSESHKFIYMPPQKTASTAVQQVLERNYGARVVEWEELGLARLPPIRYGTRGKHVLRLPERYADYFVFCTARNPYTRTVSQFRYLRDRGLCGGFRAYLEEYLPLKSESLYYDLGQHPGYEPPTGCVRFTLHAVVRQECLEEDFARLPFVGRRVSLPRVNETAGVRRRWYSPETAEMVLEHRREDFEFFGYDTAVPEGWM